MEIGDVVRLKSGGPEMVVVYVGSNLSGQKVVQCQWFSGKMALKDSFPEAGLSASALHQCALALPRFAGAQGKKEKRK